MTTNRWRLDGQLALVTGASAGIGLAIAEAMSEAGAYVVNGEINTETGEPGKAEGERIFSC